MDGWITFLNSIWISFAGLDINMALKGLMTLSTMVDMATCAQSEDDVMNAMVMKARHSENIAKLNLNHGLKQTIFS